MKDIKITPEQIVKTLSRMLTERIKNSVNYKAAVQVIAEVWVDSLEDENG